MTHPATAPSYDQLPIIDLSAADRGPQARALLHAQLHSAAHEVGSFQLVGHGVTAAETDALLQATHAFFRLPETERLALDHVNSPHFRGYTRTGDEQTGELRYRHDQLDIGPERPARAPASGEPAYWWLQGPNQWPAALPGLRTAALAWIDRLSGVARRLLHELLTAIGAPAGFYDPVLGEHAHPHLKLVRYPGGGAESRARAGQGAGARKDCGFLTLLTQDRTAGAFVVNLGASLETATGGYLLATDHRAVSPPGATERLSVPFFYNPRLDARVEPLPFPYARAVRAAPGATGDPADPVLAEYGHHELKGKLTAHPLVAERHHAGLMTPA